MTKEELLKEFMSDPLVLEKNYLTLEELDALRWTENSAKIVELFKLAIQQHNDGQSNNMISRNINQKLNN